jgi:hypothetical protein
MLRNSKKWFVLASLIISLFVAIPSFASIIRNPATAPIGISATIGDIKWGAQSTDHAGWIMMNGRVLTGGTLTITQINQATSLGIAGIGQIPDLRNKTMIGAYPAANIALASFGGNGSINIAQANLPIVNLTATGISAGTPSGSVAVTIGTDGTHQHNYDQWAGAIKRNVSGGSGLGVLDTNGANSAIAGQTYSSTTSSAHTHSASASFSGATLPIHTHTVPLGGTNTPINIQNPYYAFNAFIYLGL